MSVGPFFLRCYARRSRTAWVDCLGRRAAVCWAGGGGRSEIQLLEQIARGHRDAQNADAFGFFDIADETILVFQLVVARRRGFGSAGFDSRADEVRGGVAQGVAHGLL